MKIRIQDDSIRFRITLKELDELKSTGALEARTHVPDSPTSKPVFTYSIHVHTAGDSAIAFTDDGIAASLSQSDFAHLCDDRNEGVYCKRQVADDRRYIFFVEKDRPASVCDKPEQWIYEEVAGKPLSVRPRTVSDK